MLKFSMPSKFLTFLKVSYCSFVKQYFIVDTFQIYLHTRFHLSPSNDSLLIIKKLTPKFRFHAATTSLFHMVKIILSKAIFLLYIYYHTSFQYSRLNGTGDAPTSQICASSMLTLKTNEKTQVCTGI
jgi:hypothetical protein